MKVVIPALLLAILHVQTRVDAFTFVTTSSTTTTTTSSTTTSSKCETPDGSEGECINLVKCKSLINLLRAKRPLPPAVGELIKRSVCRFNSRIPDVCCPSTKTATPTTTTTTTTSTSSTTTTTTSTSSTTTTPSTTSSATTTTSTTSSATTTTSATRSTTSSSTTTSATTTSSSTTSSPSSESPLNTVGLIDSKLPSTLKLPDVSVCGLSSTTHTRIVGGAPSELHAWPWIAALGYQANESAAVKFLCGGALITSRHVLTAAHCVVRDDLKLVRLGEHELESDADGASPLDVLVARKLLHVDYHPRRFDNDIALLEFTSDIEFVANVIGPICLPEPDLNTSLVGSRPHVAGWGSTSFRGSTSDQLLEIQLQVLSNVECAERFSDFPNVNVSTSSKLCAMDPFGVKDACQGDSGGPMMIPIESKRQPRQPLTPWHLVGIVSFGYKCAVPGFPGVYTRVASFRSWIEKNIQQDFEHAMVIDVHHNN